MKLFYLMTLVACAALAVEKKVKLEDLPPAVREAVRKQTTNATLLGLSTERKREDRVRGRN
jgi:hypothetical protein